MFGFTLLETVNYLEHYGLLRQKTASGRYERCAPVHSWNSDHIVTNLFLYHLQRHSDHHANPTRRYQTLRSMDGRAQPAQRLRVDDRADVLPAAVAQGDGPPGARALRRRHHPGEHAPAVRDKVLARYGAARMTAYRCPGCDYVYDEAKGAPREGFRRARSGATYPTTGAAPTVRYARRSTSKR